MTLISRLLGILTITASSALAGHEVVKETIEPSSPFDKGRMELQIGVGGFYSIGDDTELRPHVNDVGGHVRLGWMLSDVASDGFFRGNWEFLTEIHGSGIIDGPGDVFLGVAILLRYNFVQPDSRCIPYFQLGGGGTYSDAHEEHPQRIIGSEFSFNLQGGFGLRYMCSDRCAVYIEAMYRHISNAGFADRNYGLNSVGGYVGLSYFF